MLLTVLSPGFVCLPRIQAPHPRRVNEMLRSRLRPIGEKARFERALKQAAMSSHKKQRWVALMALLAVVSATSALATHTVHRFIYWQTHADEPIRPWMSVGYVSRAYRVPRELLYQALQLPVPQGRDKRPISNLARLQKRAMQQEIDLLESAIARSRQPSPTPGAPTPGASSRPEDLKATPP
jgi:hypothetical protein